MKSFLASSKPSPKVVFLVFLLALFFITQPVQAQGETPPIVVGEISAARVIAFVAALLTLLLDYFPILAEKYDGLPTSTKQLLAVGIAFVVVAAAFGLTCAKIISTNLSCSASGAWDALSGVIYLIIIQYSLHQATKPSKSFKEKVLKFKK